MTKQPRLLKVGELLGKWNIRRAVKDPALRRKLTPNYRAGCKRILNSDTYYRGIANPKTEVITDAHRADHAATASSPPTAPSARSTSWCSPPASTSPTPTPTSTSRAPAARTWWTGGTARAWRRTAASPSPTCPTCSSCSARTPALGHNSVVFMIESQIRYVAAGDRRGGQGATRRRWRRRARRRTSSTTSCRRDLAGTVWSTGGCRSWYMDEHGVNRTLWSGMTWQYWLATRKFKAVGVHILRVRRRSLRADRDTRTQAMLCCRRVVGTPVVVSMVLQNRCRQT